MSPRILISLAFVMLLHFRSAPAEDWTAVLDLRGQWKIEMGDQVQWAEPSYDDRTWEDIFVPAPWEDEGFPGYDGYAWYRKHFTANAKMREEGIYLHLGNVDDVCEVFLNGNLIGYTGSFPPAYTTAYDATVQLPVAPALFRTTGENVLAVRVYDRELSGGILRGQIGFYQRQGMLVPDLSLAGIWKFRTGDNTTWAASSLDDREWKDLVVPALWDIAGLRDYDGYGWYRLSFRIPEKLRDQRLVLVMGKIDDLDETYINGERVGRTGRMPGSTGYADLGNTYTTLRAYTIPPGVLHPGMNTIAVRVYDGFLHGGIYEGPVGLVTRDRFRKWQNANESQWERFFNLFR